MLFFLSLLVTVVETSQEDLVKLQKELSNLKQALFAFKSATAFANDYINLGCNMIPENFCAGFCVYNPGEGICFIMALVTMVIQHVVVLALQITFDMVNRDIGSRTLGVNQAIYGYEYSKATYQNVKALKKWQFESLSKINKVIEVQHTSMREHLQERHFVMEQ